MAQLTVGCLESPCFGFCLFTIQGLMCHGFMNSNFTTFHFIIASSRCPLIMMDKDDYLKRAPNFQRKYDGYTINAAAKKPRKAPMTCKKNCAPCWNISVLFPRTNNADIKDMKIDAVTGTSACYQVRIHYKRNIYSEVLDV